MLIIGTCLERWQVAVVGAVCTLLAEAFAPFPWELAAGVPRDTFMFASFFGTGLFAHESARNRRLTEQHVHEVEKEVALRRDAEQQLQALIGSSPAAILTIDAAGKILMANDAAHRLLGFETGALTRESIEKFLPPLGRVPAADDLTPSFRTAMQCSGRRRDGDVFLADIWFSTYQTSAGPRLAAMLIDSSEIFAAKRNRACITFWPRRDSRWARYRMKSAMSALPSGWSYENLSRQQPMSQNEDFRALGDLVEGLGKIAAMELRQSASSEEPTPVDLRSVLDELSIVIGPSLRESGVLVRWYVPKDLPRVWAERHNLLQVLLNLTKNSQRAMQDEPVKEFRVSACREGEHVVVRVRDTGRGVSNPERLFQPFQEGAEATGLGLYLSRAFVRKFNGDLRYEPESLGCCFALDLMPFAEQAEDDGVPEPHGQNQNSPS